MNRQEKMKSVKAILKELEDMVSDHLEDGEGLDINALDLVKSAIEIYENYSQDGE